MSEPLFLFSLPRAGSTLTQRLLAAHPAICSAAEPWILLPLFHALDKASFAEYNATAARLSCHESGRVRSSRWASRSVAKITSVAFRLSIAATTAGLSTLPLRSLSRYPANIAAA